MFDNPSAFLKAYPQDKLKALEDNAAKLKRNLAQMSPEQKERYQAPLKALAQKVNNEVRDLLLEWTLGGYLFFEGDTEDRNAFILTCRRITEEENARGTFRAWGRAFFTSYSLSDAMTAATPFHDRILNDAYKPYWEKCCVLREDGHWYSRILRAEWDPEAGTWKDDSGHAVRAPLPPEK